MASINSARMWLAEGLQKGDIPEGVAAEIMRVIDDPDIIKNLEKESEIFKELITKQLK